LSNFLRLFAWPELRNKRFVAQPQSGEMYIKEMEASKCTPSWGSGMLSSTKI